MADVHDKKTRSFNMSRIRSKDTKPELLVRKYLFGKGFRYMLYDKTLPGKPDLVFPKFRACCTNLKFALRQAQGERSMC
ncbi:MAG: hypothetical protein HZA17_04295 [Nitrospirae bacterium]|nr:hypothetical protein [Nitrospirota bacterium]